MSNLRIVVIGSGYVGLTTGACLASFGHLVTCIDNNPTAVEALSRGHTHLLEPDMDLTVTTGLASGLLRFTTALEPAVTDAKVLFLCLPTPAASDGSADLSAIEGTILRIRRLIPANTVVVTKSTVPVGTHEKINAWLDRDDVSVVSNPEFLREGHAVYDFLHPARIVIGATDPEAAKVVASLYDPIRTEVIITDPATAELSKYAANCFLATKLSYINTIAELCEKLGADTHDVVRILGADHRIGGDYLQPGPGWGGPCLPKDTLALLHQAQDAGVAFPQLVSTISSNSHHQDRVVALLREALYGDLHGIRVALLGLTFKAGSNDLRNSPARRIAQTLADHGASVVAHDPTIARAERDIRTTSNITEAASGAEAVVLLTAWPIYRDLDWKSIAGAMAGTLVLDTCGVLDQQRLAEIGLRHVTIGGGIGDTHRHAPH